MTVPLLRRVIGLPLASLELLGKPSAAEFLAKKDYGENWFSEVHEGFTFWSLTDWVKELHTAGLYVFTNAVGVSTVFMATRTYGSSNIVGAARSRSTDGRRMRWLRPAIRRRRSSSSRRSRCLPSTHFDQPQIAA